MRKVFYKMNSKLWIGILIGGLYATNVFSGYTVYAAEGDKTTDYTSMEEYAYFESVIGDTAAAYSGSGSYALYDIDQDGTRELILSFGESNANWMNYIYTLENGTPFSIGNFYNPVMLYVAEDNNGIYSVYGHMGSQIVNRITKQDKQILIETIMEGDVGEADYYSNGSPIMLADFPGYEMSHDEVQVEMNAEAPISEGTNYTVDYSGTSRPDGYLFPDSSNYMFQGYSDQYQAWMYQYGINEIYARHGYIFQTPEVASLFSGKTWYTPDEYFDESYLSEVERYNIDFLSTCLSINGGDGGYGLPSNEQSEPSASDTDTWNLFDVYGGYYTNPDTFRIIKIYATNPSYSSYDGILEMSKRERVSPDEGGVMVYELEQSSENTATIISDRKGAVLERGTMTFYDGEVHIYWSDNGTSERYVAGMP